MNKKLFILIFIVTTMLVLTGCMNFVEDKDGKAELPLEERIYFYGFNEEDSKILFEKFENACSDIGMDMEQIEKWEKADTGTPLGEIYTFIYKDYKFNTKADKGGLIIRSISSREKEMESLYLRGYEPINVDGFLTGKYDINAERKKVEIEETETVDEKGQITLVYGELGTYGEIETQKVPDSDRTEEFINYHIPAGKYTVRNNGKWAVVFILDKKETDKVVHKIEFGKANETFELDLKKAEMIFITIGANITLIPFE